ncbi:hypothetical protein GPJ56_002442 [Histomonas meleagridis]|uniref:uncharacterized protein n=1 Tax=Histomonas meleagridis TaxID=135588 RepID=UPI003559FAAC|nr:hypothetical protein GPJ56_002442 [Histomonas meleagridis]KAH0798273.1 hypothetical protein GO595_008961 [Histomonas meleagridis]
MSQEELENWLKKDKPKNANRREKRRQQRLEKLAMEQKVQKEANAAEENNQVLQKNEIIQNNQSEDPPKEIKINENNEEPEIKKASPWSQLTFNEPVKHEETKTDIPEEQKVEAPIKPQQPVSSESHNTTNNNNKSNNYYRNNNYNRNNYQRQYKPYNRNYNRGKGNYRNQQREDSYRNQRTNKQSFVWRAPPRFESNDDRVRYFREGPIPILEQKIIISNNSKNRLPLSPDSQQLIDSLNDQLTQLGKLERPDKKDLDSRVSFFEQEISKLNKEIETAQNTINNLNTDYSKRRQERSSSIQKSKELSFSISRISKLINESYRELDGINTTISTLKAQHLEFERKFGVKSVSSLHSKVEEIESQIQSNNYNLSELRKKLGSINKYQRKSVNKYSEMGENEEKQFLLLNQRMDLYQKIKELKSEKSELIEEKNLIDENLENNKTDFIEEKEKIKNLENEIKTKKSDLEEKKKKIVKILEYFFKTLDVYEEKLKEVKRIEEEKEKIYEAEREKRKRKNV